jgi:hypothetical protein
MNKDPETYEAALERQRTRPRPNPAMRYTGRPIMTMIAEALGPMCHDAVVRSPQENPTAAYGCVLDAGHDGQHQNREGVRYGDILAVGDDWWLEDMGTV